MREPFSHSKLLKLLVYGAAAALIALAPTGASAGKFKVQHSFCSKAGCADGGNPEAPLVRDAEGNFFGTAPNYGVHNFGIAYELQNLGSGKYKFKIVYAYTFSDGSPNNSGLIVGRKPVRLQPRRRILQVKLRIRRSSRQVGLNQPLNFGA